MPTTCVSCKTARAQILRPKDYSRLCAPCFTSAFESEALSVIQNHALFHRGERIAIGASGGKDSCVLASVLTTLNARHDLGLDLVLLSIDEGITGYRDHSLDAVRRNAAALGLPLQILSYADLYGWSMDQVVAQIGKKGNCTYCGVFRRQALDRGAARLGVRHVVTGHNADDVAETVLMNLLRGDLARLGRSGSIVTSTPGQVKEERPDGTEEVLVTEVKRSKPLMYAYEKEIVLYAHHKKLDYFSTECVYSPEAFRGTARTLIKNLERIRPETILDIVKSGVEMARMVPDSQAGRAKAPSGKGTRIRIAVDEDDDSAGGCGSGAGGGSGGDMAAKERELQHVETGGDLETEITLPVRGESVNGSAPQSTDLDGSATKTTISPTSVPIRSRRPGGRKTEEAKLGKCSRCGYLSSQAVCKACMLLEGLNKARPRAAISLEQTVV